MNAQPLQRRPLNNISPVNLPSTPHFHSSQTSPQQAVLDINFRIAMCLSYSAQNQHPKRNINVAKCLTLTAVRVQFGECCQYHLGQLTEGPNHLENIGLAFCQFFSDSEKCQPGHEMGTMRQAKISLWPNCQALQSFEKVKLACCAPFVKAQKYELGQHMGT